VCSSFLCVNQLTAQRLIIYIFKNSIIEEKGANLQLKKTINNGRKATSLPQGKSRRSHTSGFSPNNAKHSPTDSPPAPLFRTYIFKNSKVPNSKRGEQIFNSKKTINNGRKPTSRPQGKSRRSHISGFSPNNAKHISATLLTEALAKVKAILQLSH
jgi:hypothetical protein